MGGGIGDEVKLRLIGGSNKGEGEDDRIRRTCSSSAISLRGLNDASLEN